MRLSVYYRTLEITSPQTSTTEYKSGDFVVEGVVSDDISATTVQVFLGDEVIDATVADGVWTATISMAQVAGDMTLSIKAIATDATGKVSAPAYVNVAVDRAAPTVLVTAPQTYSPEPTFSDYVVVQGESWDVSPLESVTVEVWDPANASAPLVSQPAEGGQSWFARISFGAGFVNGTSYLYRVLAVDAAGNVNTYHYHASDLWDRLPTGKLFPAMVDIGKWDQQGVPIPDIQAVDLISLTSTRLPTSGNDALGLVYDGDIDKPQISLTNLDALLPVDQNVIGEQVPIFASAIDDKEGIDTSSVSLALTGLSDPAYTNTVAGSTFNSPGDGLYTSWQFDLVNGDLLVPGRYAGVITVDDKKGIRSTLSFQFIVDSGAPQIVSIVPSDNYVGTEANGDVILTVQIQDDNTGSVFTVTPTDASDASALTFTSVLAASTTPLVDGKTVYVDEYTITIVAPFTASSIDIGFHIEDTAGLVNSRTINYLVDTGLPIVAITTPTVGAQISGNAMTAAGSSSTDTLQVYVALLADTDPAPNPTNLPAWTIAEGNQTWSVQLDLSNSLVTPEGDYILYAFSEDLAGNSSTVQSSAFSFDLDAPALAETGIGTTSIQRLGSAFELSGTSSDSNGVFGITVTQKKDSGAAVTIPATPNGPVATMAGWATWELTGLPRNPVDPSNTLLVDGNYEYQITAVDTAGKISTVEVRNFIFDTTIPSVEITQVTPLVGSSTVNGTITFNASASDDSGISGVKWAILTAATPAPDYASATNTFASVPYTETIDTVATLADLTAYKLWVVAQDRAGQETIVSFDLNVDQSSDTPVIVLSNMDASFDTLAEAGGNLQETGAKVSGVVNDDDNVNVGTLQIAVDGVVVGAVSSPPASNGKSVSFEHDLSALTEGPHYLEITVADINAQATTSGTVYFNIDKSGPSVSITSPGQGSFHNSVTTLSGTASDINSLRNSTMMQTAGQLTSRR